MNSHLLLSFLFISVVSCLDNTKSPGAEIIIGNHGDDTIKSHKDKIVTLFGDSSYRLTLQTFDSTNYDQESKNAVLTLSKQLKNYETVIFRDSLYCLYPDIDFKDFNNDRIEDVMVFYFTGARANPTYHLYLTDLENRRLNRVKGFEELPNPDLDTTNNIITSIALSGTNNYSFYRINKENKLINLGYSYAENPKDSLQYERTIRKIEKNK